VVDDSQNTVTHNDAGPLLAAAPGNVAVLGGQGTWQPTRQDASTWETASCWFRFRPESLRQRDAPRPKSRTTSQSDFGKLGNLLTQPSSGHVPLFHVDGASPHFRAPTRAVLVSYTGPGENPSTGSIGDFRSFPSAHVRRVPPRRGSLLSASTLAGVPTR